MEFLNSILAEISGQKIEYSQTRVFVSFSTFVFLFYKMLFMNRLEFSSLTWIFVVGVLKPKKSMVFFKEKRL